MDWSTIEKRWTEQNPVLGNTARYNTALHNALQYGTMQYMKKKNKTDLHYSIESCRKFGNLSH